MPVQPLRAAAAIMITTRPDPSLLFGAGLLTLQQLPLSIANSIIANALLVADLFPARKDVTVENIATTYGIMNVVAPFFGGIPVCHGCGGLAGHYRFGARIGGSVVICGSIFLVVGLFFSSVVTEVLAIFPFPVLGVILAFEWLALVLLVEKAAVEPNGLAVAVLVGALILAVPYGYLVGMVVGTLAFLALRRSGVRLGPCVPGRRLARLVRRIRNRAGARDTRSPATGSGSRGNVKESP